MRALTVGVATRVAIVVAVLVVSTTSPVLAGTVVGTGNRASCTEAALDAALAGGGSITFSCGTRPFTVTVTTTKTIAADTSLDGGGLITLGGGGKRQIFNVNPGVTLELSNATLNRGSADVGGAIYNDGTLAVTNCSFNRCTAFSGGAIHNDGTLAVTNCTFSGNRAANGGDGGAIDNYGTATVASSTFFSNRSSGVSGAIENNGTLTVSNSTFAHNHALNGGAIASGGTQTVITNCTISSNTSGRFAAGGAIYSGGDTIVQNTILAYSGRGGNCAGPIPVTDGGNNLRWPPSDASCVGTVGDPKLAMLANNGGPTRTMRLKPGSAAIDAGDNATCSALPVDNHDQRGVVRPGPSSTNCSIGAYEF